ncbi:PDR/VanB family oxidoreductase [Alicyclobacillus pomorum]|uniref:PDR/VanB family oxidoreductase n=1 Tax=Alicyclobacillus pomorum TaxID=204470 RepID=UPI000424981D|nr:PDR/VanB family oxidoreductase [Alicyclobacillus pomorum]
MRHDAILTVRVAQIHQETPVVKRFTLVPVGTDRLPPFSAGAHITTYAAFDGRVLERNYSLCNHPGTRNVYEIAIRRSDNGQGGSAGWHHHIRVGDTVHISPPKNHFPLSQRARHHVFLAAGIGITPFLSMMAELRARNGLFELHYAAPSRSYCAFREVIETSYPESRFYFSEEGMRLSPNVLCGAKVGTHVYICGPSSFIEAFSQQAEAMGFPKSNIHAERFTAPTPENPRPFRVTLRKSGRDVEVAAHETLLAALLRAGVRVRYACRAGGCGTCELGVVEGEVEHRDVYLTDEEKAANTSIIACVSRAAGDRLVLDL